MAYSSDEGKGFFVDWLIHFARPLGFTRFLDIGCGAGRYGDIIRTVFGPEVIVDAVEPFGAYVVTHNLKEKYDKIYLEDISDCLWDIGEYDLIIAGDVLEHIERDKAIDLVANLRRNCKFLWGAIPITVEGRAWSRGYKQDPEEWAENKYNEHKHDWSMDEIQDCFLPLWVVPYLITGCFLVEGDL
jgi:SAM-dependent methyltransferase